MGGVSDIIWGVLFVLFGTFVAGQGWVLYRDPEAASERERSNGAHIQPAWAVRRWTRGDVRARAISMFVGGPAFVVFGVLLLTRVIHLG